MLCACVEGTVFFDHDAKKWKSGDHRCAKPEPRHPAMIRPERVEQSAPPRRVVRKPR